MTERQDIVENVIGSPLSSPVRAESSAQDYRLFFLDAVGHISRGIDIKFHNDSDAIAYAKTVGSPHGMELWQARRMVREFLPGE